MKLKIEVGPCEPWVKAAPFADGSGFAVECEHCHGKTFGFMPYLTKHPDAPARWVAQHNQCAEKDGG